MWRKETSELKYIKYIFKQYSSRQILTLTTKFKLGRLYSTHIIIRRDFKL